jgi:hypothetical protein
VLKKILLIFFLISQLIAYPQDTTRTPVNHKKLALIIGVETSLYLGSMAYLKYIWYKDAKRTPFTFYNDNKGYLQIDKCGHAFGSYLESYIGYHWLRDAGVKRSHALIFGGTLGLILQTPIEVFDAYYEKWGFSKGDMVANAAGSAFVIGQELAFREQVFKYKFSFWRSEFAEESNGYLGKNFLQSIFYDYNGHTYWLSTNINRVILKDKIPSWIAIAAGYSADGMFGEFTNKRKYNGVLLPRHNRTRQFLLTADIDWTKIKTRNKILKPILKAMFFIKLPFPAIEINSEGKLKGYWLYF